MLPQGITSGPRGLWVQYTNFFKEMIPSELWNGEKFNLGNLRSWGCSGFAHIHHISLESWIL